MPKRLPHLRPFAAAPIVFLTVVTRDRRPILTDPTPFGCLTRLWERSAELDGWFVGDFLLMPDHVHLFVRSSRDAKPLSAWVRTWKSLSSRKLAPLVGAEESIWQRDYFDRFLRSGDDYAAKWDYVAANPVRKSFCETSSEWPWKGRLHDLTF